MAMPITPKLPAASANGQRQTDALGDASNYGFDCDHYDYDTDRIERFRRGGRSGYDGGQHDDRFISVRKDLGRQR